MIPPFFIDLTIITDKHRPIRIWLPFVLLWPIMMVLYIIVMPIAIIMQIALSRTRIKPFSILIGLHRLVSSLKGTMIDVGSHSGNNKCKVKIHIA